MRGDVNISSYRANTALNKLITSKLLLENWSILKNIQIKSIDNYVNEVTEDVKRGRRKLVIHSIAI